MSISLNPIGPWPYVAVGATFVIALTIWAYRLRLRGSTGVWRWFALGLRLAAVFLCVLATLRPSIHWPEKKKQSAVAFQAALSGLQLNTVPEPARATLTCRVPS